MTLKRLLVSCAMFAACPLPAWAGGLAGRVSDWQGDTAAISVVRDGTAIQPLQRTMPVMEYDTIVITSPDTQLSVRLVNGETKVLSSGRTQINGLQPPDGISNKLWAWATGLMGQLAQTNGPSAPQMVALTTRGDKLSAPLLQGDKTRMLAPKNGELHLAWLGGVPPYHVKVLAIRNGRQDVVAAAELLTEPRLDTQDVPLPVGDYVIIVSDSCINDIDCRKIESGIEVMPNDALPPPLSDTFAGAPVERMVQLLQLAAYDHMAWSLEVYQRVAAETGNPDIEALRRSIVDGVKITPP